MYVALISLSFPLQFLMSYIYSRYTDRVFVIRSTSLVDLTIAALVILWFEKYEQYRHAENDGFGLSDPHKPSHIFMQELINNIRTDTFHFDWLLSAVAFLFWIRVIFLLKLTNTFGPLIAVTWAMMRDLMTFFFLFSIQLIAFSCVGILTFGSLDAYSTLEGTLFMFLETAFGNWNLSIYDELSGGKKYFGIIFHLVAIVINLLLLLNLIIAIMSDTYAQLTDMKLGLYL